VSQTALYRKWRPQDFSTVVGQSAIVQTLKNAVLENRTAHAYLFCGPRGTGKTSTARILAKSVNCEQLENGEPCNRCSACVGITQGTELDVLEIDAASQTGVDNIRLLREQINFVPVFIRKKVVIIDEVHMLSTSSFNALLKTLEEPPEHVLFVLATTEMHKLPATVISRCQRFEFKRITLDEQVNHLRHVCQKEEIHIGEDALRYLGRLSEGGMRDALSLLDQTIAYAGRNIDIEKLIAVTGGVQLDQYEHIFDALVQRDVGQMISIVQQMVEQGKNPAQCLHNLLEFFRDMVVFKLIPDSPHTQLLFLEPRWREKIEEFSVPQIYSVIHSISQSITEMKYAAHSQMMLELALMKLCTGSPTSTDFAPQADPGLLQKIQQLESRVQQLTAEVQQLKSAGVVHTPTPMFKNGVAPKVAAVSDAGTKDVATLIAARNSHDTKKLGLEWPRVLAALKEKFIGLHSWVKEGDVRAFTLDSVLLVFQHKTHFDATARPENKKIVQDIILEIYGFALRVCVIQLFEWEQLVGAQQPPTELILEPPSIETPAQAPWVTEALQLFGEALVEISEDNKGENTNE
jgi:DNA polymerase-3 subunit gamma/tau